MYVTKATRLVTVITAVDYIEANKLDWKTDAEDCHLHLKYLNEGWIRKAKYGYRYLRMRELILGSYQQVSKYYI